MPSIEEQLRFFAVKVNDGSGCIFQPDTKDYTYVLTVKHNLEIKNEADEKILMPKESIRIYRENVESDALAIVDYQVHGNLDLALIVIPFIGASEMTLSYSNPVKDDSLILYGYPNRLKELAEKRDDVRCICNLRRADGYGSELRTEQGQHTWDINTQNSMLGFSGCGIFSDLNGTLILRGIFPALKDPTGANDKLVLLNTSNFSSIIKESGLKPLIPSTLLSFESYSSKIFKRVNPGLKGIFDKNIQQVIERDITPIAIAERNKEKLTLPTSANYTDSLTQSGLWKAWLELLTLLDIAIPEAQDLESCCGMVPLYFSAQENHIKKLIKIFLSDATLRGQIRKGTLIAFSSIETSGGKEYLNKEEIKKIVAILDRPDFFNDRMMIGDATQVPSFSCVHIDHFSTRIDQLDVDELQSNEILDLIKSEITNILNYA